MSLKQRPFIYNNLINKVIKVHLDKYWTIACDSPISKLLNSRLAVASMISAKMVWLRSQHCQRKQAWSIPFHFKFYPLNVFINDSYLYQIRSIITYQNSLINTCSIEVLKIWGSLLERAGNKDTVDNIEPSVVRILFMNHKANSISLQKSK